MNVVSLVGRHHFVLSPPSNASCARQGGSGGWEHRGAAKAHFHPLSEDSNFYPWMNAAPVLFCLAGVMDLFGPGNLSAKSQSELLGPKGSGGWGTEWDMLCLPVHVSAS